MVKKSFLFFVLAFFIAFGNTFVAKKAKAEDIATAFTMYKTAKIYPADAVFYNAKGNAVKLSDFKGKVVILNFWKATCRKCLIEMPGLNELAEKYKDVAVIAVSEGNEKAALIEKILHAERRLNQIEVNLDDNQKLFHALGGDKVPQTRLIDKNGKIVGQIKGQADFRSAELLKQIETYLQ